MSEAANIPIIYGRIISSMAGQNPAETRQILAGTCLDHSANKSGLVGMTVSDYVQILRNAALVSGNNTIALEIGSKQILSSHGAMGRAARNAPSLKSSLETLATFTKIRAPFCSFRLTNDSSNTRLQFELDDTLQEQANAALDFIVGSIAQSINELAWVPLSRFELKLTRPKPPEADTYKALLPCSVVFNNDTNEMVFSTRELQQEVIDADPDEYFSAIKRCREIYASRDLAISTTDAVINSFDRMSGHLCSLEDIAKQLHLSPRTLQRKLSAENAAFKPLRDAWLSEQASHLLINQQLSVEATAALLGYGDEANFRRAFKRWYQCTPSQFKNRNIQGINRHLRHC